MFLEREYIGGEGGREGTDRNEGGNLLDGPAGKEGGGGGWELSPPAPLRAAGPSSRGPPPPPPGPAHTSCLGTHPHSGGSRLEGVGGVGGELSCRWKL